MIPPVTIWVAPTGGHRQSESSLYRGAHQKRPGGETREGIVSGVALTTQDLCSCLCEGGEHRSGEERKGGVICAGATGRLSSVGAAVKVVHDAGVSHQDDREYPGAGGPADLSPGHHA